MTSTATLNPNLRPFWTTKARNKILYGGRSSSKTWDAAGMAVYLASKYNIRFLCTRQFQNKIEESVYTTLKMQINRFNLQDEFTILNNKIIHDVTGSEFIFYGLWRNIDEIKSLEDIDICWIEEAHNLTKEQWDILEPTIRKQGSEFWIIFNPRLITDFVYQRFVVNPPANTLVRKINFNENPFLSDTIRSLIDEKYKEDPDEASHIYGGEPKTDDNDSIIKRSWVLAAVDAHKKLNREPSGAKTVGFDIADDGGDTNATVLRYGFLVTEIEEWEAKEHELNKSARRTYNIALENGANIIYDSIGVGASAGSEFKDLNTEKKKKIVFDKFNAADKVRDPDSYFDKHNKITNKDMFSNLKAQSWWKIAERFKATYNAIENGKDIDDTMLIAIDSNVLHLEKLITELTQPRKDIDTLGRVKVESKKDMKKRGINSPNIADAFIMAYADVKNVNKLIAAMRENS